MAGSDKKCLSDTSAIICTLRDRGSCATIRSAPDSTAVLTDTYPVQWAGRQAVVTLPDHIGAANAGQIRGELLSVINRGAETVIADMTTTISCDQAGTDGVVRACQTAVISGVDLRLVVAARSRWRRPGLGGLDGLVCIYPSLEAAVTAGSPEGTGTAGSPEGTVTAGSPEGTGTAGSPAEQAYRRLELFDTIVTSLFHAGLSMHLAMDLPADAAREHIAAAVTYLDETIAEVRKTAFTGCGQQAAPRCLRRDNTA
jgi:hypothetical protein